METRAHFVLIGSFALAAAGALLTFALWISNASLNRSWNIYDVVFSGPVRGLAEGSEVRFQGIKVGEVTNLRWDMQNTNMVVARVRVLEDTPVRTSSAAQLEPLGLTGVSLVQLTAGDPSDPLLRRRPGRPIPQIAGKPGQFEDILAAGQVVAARAAEVLASVQTVLSPENIKRLNAILADVESITNELEQNKALAGEARTAVRELTTTAQAVGQTADAFETLARDVDGRFTGLADETDATLKQARQTLAAVETTANAGTASLQRIEDAVGVAANDTLPELTLAVQDLRRLSTALESVASNLDEDPTGFMFGSRKPTVELKK